jgi:hypothetical protein
MKEKMPDLFGDGAGQIPKRMVMPPDPKPLTTDLEGCPQEIANLFERLALQLHREGRSHFSSDAILHRIRWYLNVERGDGDFKCNDHWTAPLARWFMASHPECKNFFELRVRKSKQT